MFQFSFRILNESMKIVTIFNGSTRFGGLYAYFQILEANPSDIFVSQLTGEKPIKNDKLVSMWDMQPCPSGYGYNDEIKTCIICAPGYYSLTPNWDSCLECAEGLSCLGQDSIRVAKGSWWDKKYTALPAFKCRRYIPLFLCVCVCILFCIFPNENKKTRLDRLVFIDCSF